MGTKRNYKLIAELGVAATAIAALILVGCGGGGGSSGSTSTSIPVSGAGNSPFVGVPMYVTCANGNTGHALIGASGVNNPGEGTIVVNGSCTTPILIAASGIGSMVPIGSTVAVAYDSSVNLPITNILTTPPTVGSPATANPVTTLVAYQVFSGANAASSIASLLTNATSSVVATAQNNVATSVGLTSPSQINNDYTDPQIAAAATRITEVAAIAAANAAANSPATGSHTLGQYIANGLASVSANLTTAFNAATALSNGTTINITTDPRVSGATNVVGSIDRDAVNVQAIVVAADQVAASTGTTLSVSNMLTSSTPSALSAPSAVAVLNTNNINQTALQAAITEHVNNSVTYNTLITDVQAVLVPVSGVTSTLTQDLANQTAALSTPQIAAPPVPGNTTTTTTPTTTTTTSTSTTQPTTTTTTSTSTTQPSTSTTTSSSTTQPSTSTTTSSSTTQPLTTTTTSTSTTQPSTSTTSTTSTSTTTSTTTTTTLASAQVCSVAYTGFPTIYVSGAPTCQAADPTTFPVTPGLNDAYYEAATVQLVAQPGGATVVPYSSITLSCPFAAVPPAAGSKVTSLSLCKL